MKNVLKDFLYFSREERRGILLLCALILLTVGLLHFYQHYREGNARATTQEKEEQIRMQQEYDSFMASVHEKEEYWEKQRYRRPDYPQDKGLIRSPKLQPFPFDPNQADSTDFCRMGLPGWMARNIVRYREKGGHFRRPEDFRKIYGLTDEQYIILQPYIHIPPEDTAHTAPQLFLPSPERDTVAHPYKYPAGTLVDLNRADTTELKKIPGIGSGIARLIAGYRQRLGGFYDIEQLRDIHLNPELLRSWFHIDTTLIRRINLNRVGVERLRRHPYFNFYQAKAIVEWRKKNGPLRNLKPFALYEEFSKTDFERQRHYVCFE